MEPKGFHRKLTASPRIDVDGYNRVMEDDKAATISNLESYKQTLFDLILQYRGQVINSQGDCLLAEFASAVKPDSARFNLGKFFIPVSKYCVVREPFHTVS